MPHTKTRSLDSVLYRADLLPVCVRERAVGLDISENAPVIVADLEAAVMAGIIDVAQSLPPVIRDLPGHAGCRPGDFTSGLPGIAAGLSRKGHGNQQQGEAEKDLEHTG